MKLVVGADSAGKPLLDAVNSWLHEQADYQVTDLSEPPDNAGELYADMCDRIAQGILDGSYQRGILICGTGIGVCISANKIPGIRAALTHDTYSAAKASSSNNAQIITLGARVIGPELAKDIVRTWLQTSFDVAGASAANVEAIDSLDIKYSLDNS